MTDEELAEFDDIRYKGPYIPYEERWRQFSRSLAEGLVEAWRAGRILPALDEDSDD